VTVHKYISLGFDSCGLGDAMRTNTNQVWSGRWEGEQCRSTGAQIFLDSGTSIGHMCMVFKLSIYFYIVLMKVKHCPKCRASCLTTIFTMRVHFRYWVSISHKPNGATRAPPF
jgi:hypothetical protein